ncbi:hypothetical protein ES705_21907 [subsurface metagenome]
MTEEQIRKLKFIKEEIKGATYAILQKPEWDEFSRDLSSCGCALLRDIEQKRNEVRKLQVSLLFFFGRRQLNKLSLDYGVIAKNFDLFFDASMRWLKCIINKNEYENYQILTKKYVEALVDHCCRASDYLGNLISTKRNEYYHYQTLFLSVVAITIAVTSVFIRGCR